MSKFIRQTYHHHHQYMKIISCNFSSHINNNNNVTLTCRRIVTNQTCKNNTRSSGNISSSGSSSQYKIYHNIDQQYRLYQSSRCILQGVENSKTTGATSTTEVASTSSSSASSSSDNNSTSDRKSSLLSNPFLKSKDTLKDSDILPPLTKDTMEKKVRPDLGIITSKSWSCTKLRHMKEEIPDDLPPPDAKWVKITKELLESTTPTVDKVANDFLSLDILELNQLFRLLQRRMGLPKNFMFNTGGVGSDVMNAAAAAAAEPVQEKDVFDVKLIEVDAKAKIKIIKEVRAITGLGLKEAKDMVEGVPVVLKQGLKKDEAEKLMKQLVDAGAKVELI